ncbi:hypothetical protein JTE90_026732 [Oedothorax gibbosus]|uniref:CcoQ/FixQ family Cbb3-type cytochrome c oxidase assembly chaperone n=1 Tax=Oedothorax gibbosus TaxID=931172 RepID=A0AAV6U5V4_9ARAC|nr:hypothetical protein JTE90_026732 [Oedothorax gibbosus]
MTVERYDDEYGKSGNLGDFLFCVLLFLLVFFYFDIVQKIRDAPLEPAPMVEELEPQRMNEKIRQRNDNFP